MSGSAMSAPAGVIHAALGAPALTELGVPLLSAHLFIFYFGCLSNITHPVALAAYAAAGVGRSLLRLPSADRDTVLKQLDEYAPLLG